MNKRWKCTSIMLLFLLAACGTPTTVPQTGQGVAASTQAASSAASVAASVAASAAPTLAPSNQPVAAASQGTAERTEQITISDNRFAAGQLTIPAGTTVVWTNAGQRPHTVTADDGSFQGETLESGATFTQTFDQAGTFAYFCEYHGAAGGSGMSGTITVTDAAVADAATTTALAEPTVGAAPAATAASAPELNLTFADAGDQRLASVALDLSAMPEAPAGKTHAVWLIDNAGKYVLLGAAQPGRTFTYSDPAGANLVGIAQGAMISLESAANVEAKALAAPTDLLFAGVQPTAILIDVRQLVVAALDTPAATSYEAGVKDQSELVATHGQLALDGIGQGDLKAGRLHVEHVSNILSGTQSPDYGDLDGDGEALNPGDGYGVRLYASKIAEVADRIAEIPGLPDQMRAAASDLGVCARNISDDWGPQVQAQGKLILAAADAAAAEGAALRLADLTRAIAAGVDANTNGTIEQVKGECGAQQLYERSRDLFNIRLTPQAIAPTVSAVAVPVAQPSVAATVEVAGGQAQVQIGDNTFTANTLQVPVGTTIVWTHQGQRRHTVTADDGSFDSGTLQKDGTFQYTFTAPGEYPYFCTIHGGAGGNGMAGVIRVGGG